MHVQVKVKAGARKEIVREVAPTRLEISVREKAENNEANERVIAIIAARYSVRTKDVRMVKGHRSPSKMFTISTTPQS